MYRRFALSNNKDDASRIPACERAAATCSRFVWPTAVAAFDTPTDVVVGMAESTYLRSCILELYWLELTGT